MYKSVKSGKGVMLNLSKTGIGISASIPGHQQPRRRATIGELSPRQRRRRDPLRRWLLERYDDLPNKEDRAVELVLEQAERFATEARGRED